MNAELTGLDLADNQFLKITMSASRYAVLFKIQQIGPVRWTFTREIKADRLAEILKDELWRADWIQVQIHGVILECFRAKELNGYTSIK